MPLLDISTAQPCLQNHNLGPLRPHANVLYGKFAFGDEMRFSESFHFPKRPSFSSGYIDTSRGKLLITAVATVEPKTLVRKECQQKNPLPDVASALPTKQPESSSDGDSDELDERERLRRMRISKANKGNTPWNKGRKHSAETLRRIRERTRIAMQNPKVKMKLANLGHAQSQETRKKIGVGVRMGWGKRREKLMVQESCYFEWQNLIAEASRRGFAGEEELQWNSYNILSEQLTREWLESVEQRKTMPRPKGSKRAPKSPEQRKKIAAAISAKWADSEYRERVCSGLAKYHGTPVGVERKPRRKPSSSKQSRTHGPGKKKDGDTRSESAIRIEKLRLQRSKTPLFKDPSASSKLEMIKNIRAQRAAAESKKMEAIERARLLIAEAEKAAKALEVAATKSPIARASLIETRKLIAEAIQSIESIETNLTSNNECEGYPLAVSAAMASQVKKEAETKNGSSDLEKHIKVNGSQTLSLSKNEDFSFANFSLPDTLNSEEFLPANSNGYSLPTGPTLNLESLIKQSDSAMQRGQPEANGKIKCENFPQPNGTKVHNLEEATPPTLMKKWIRGKLVEVTDGA